MYKLSIFGFTLFQECVSKRHKGKRILLRNKFSRDKGSSSGLQCWCKSCSREATKISHLRRIKKERQSRKTAKQYFDSKTNYEHNFLTLHNIDRSFNYKGNLFYVFNEYLILAKRHILQKKLGRLLPKGTRIGFKDNDRNNYDPNNLFIKD